MGGGLGGLERALVASFGRERVRRQVPLGSLCSFEVGGPAEILLTARTADELLRAARFCREFGQPLTVLGGGANVLVSDLGVRGLVVRNRAERIEPSGEAGFEVDSGTPLSSLAHRAREGGVGGFEFLVGIPGTVGGAVCGNAGTRTRWFAEVLESTLLLAPDGTVLRASAAELGFDYRRSRLRGTGEIVLSAVVRGRAEEAGAVARATAGFLVARRSQPAGPSAGSVFKNPPHDFAGRLIDACGLKGRRVGGAEISRRHANFILNAGGASARDIRSLVDLAKAEVAARAGVVLEEEIRTLGEWP